MIERKNHLNLSWLLFGITWLVVAAAAEESEEAERTICEKIFDSLREGNETQLQSHVEELQQSAHEPCVVELLPRYYWGQNMSHILVKFEFLNSADTSACDRVLSVKREAEHNKISLSLVCLQSNFVIRYRIAVTTLMPLNYFQAVWKQAEQNSLILECMKSPNPYFWKRLYLPSQPPLRRPKVWWKMVEKYMDNLKKFIYDLEVEEEEFDVSSYVKKRKSRVLKESQQLEPSSKRQFYCNQNNPFELGSWLW